MRELLQRQLEIGWGFAQAFVVGQVDEELALWERSPHICTVRRRGGRWVADWPDEENPPLPDVSIAWLLWHIEWWWEQTIRSVEGAEPRAPQEHEWSGSTSGIVTAKRVWDGILAGADLERERSPG